MIYNKFNETIIESVQLINGQVEVICYTYDNCIPAIHPAPPPSKLYWKDIYSIINGQIKLTKTIKGKYKTVTKEVKTEELTFEE